MSTTTIYRSDRSLAHSSHERGTYAVEQILYVLLNIVVTLLAIRTILRLLAANAASPFVQFIYNLTAPLVAPFRGIFPQLSATASAVDWAAIVAMIVYALVVYAIVRLIQAASTRYDY